MSKLRCECGSILSDVTDEENRSWGLLLSSQEVNQANSKVSEVIADFIASLSNEMKNEWLLSFFGSGYQNDLAIAEFISDIISKISLEFGLAYAKCKNCDAILIQNKVSSNVYSRYVRQSKEEKAIW